MSVVDAIESASPAADPLLLAKLPTDDLGMAERLRLRYGDKIAKTPDAGWLAYDGQLWVKGHRGEAQVRIFAHQTARALWEEYNAAKKQLDVEPTAEPLIEGERKGPDWAFIKGQVYDAIGTAGDSKSTNAMIAQAAPYLAAELKDFDPDPTLICCTNGTVKPTFIGEPCFVVFDKDGVPVEYLKASFVADAAPRSEAAIDTAPMWKIAGWRIRQLPRDGDGPLVFEVLGPGEEEADISRIGKADLAVGVKRGEAMLKHCLYHLDLKLLPHQPGHKITRQTTVAWNPAAKAEIWREHMETVLPIEEDRKFFQRAMGYSMLGTTEAQCFLLMQGRGADGKSTTMKTIVRVMGSYHHTSSPLTWMETKQRSGSDASPDMADLAGDTRGVYAEEPPKGARINEGLLKQVTGGLEMRARQLHRDLFDFEPRFLLVIAFNDLFRIVGGDDGFWRRMRFIRWPHQFTEKADVNMVEKLLAEGPGIFNWLLEGLAAYHKHGLKPTARMAQDILDWRSTADPFGEWLRDRVEIKAGAKELTSGLYQDYKDFLEAEGIDGREVLGLKAFQNRLASQQIEAVKTDGGKRYRRGVQLRPRPPEWGVGGGLGATPKRKSGFDDGGEE